MSGGVIGGGGRDAMSTSVLRGAAPARSPVPRSGRQGPSSGRPWGVYVASALLGGVIVAGLAMPHHGRALFAAEPPTAPLEAARALRFEPGAHDALLVLDARTGQRIAVFAAEQAGFLHGLAHGLAATRRRENLAADGTYTLSLYADGRLILTDPPTHTTIDIESFGPTNVASLVSLLAAGGRA